MAQITVGLHRAPRSRSLGAAERSCDPGLRSRLALPSLSRSAFNSNSSGHESGNAFVAKARVEAVAVRKDTDHAHPELRRAGRRMAVAMTVAKQASEFYRPAMQVIPITCLSDHHAHFFVQGRLAAAGRDPVESFATIRQAQDNCWSWDRRN
jgi:hypothetical protein